MEVKLSAEQIKKLEDALLEVPAKYAIPLLQLINGFIQENSVPAKGIQEAEEV